MYLVASQYSTLVLLNRLMCVTEYQLAINIVDGCGPSNEMLCEFLPKKTEGSTVLAIQFIVKGILLAVQY